MAHILNTEMIIIKRVCVVHIATVWSYPGFFLIFKPLGGMGGCLGIPPKRPGLWCCQKVGPFNATLRKMARVPALMGIPTGSQKAWVFGTLGL